MRSVFSIDSEGIWNACTAKVIRKTAMTIVAASDCNVLMVSESAASVLATAARRAVGNIAVSRSTETSLTAILLLRISWQKRPDGLRMY